MVAYDQLRPHFRRLTHHLRRNVQSKQHRTDLRIARSHKKARVVKSHCGMKRCKCIDKIIKLSNSRHNQSSFFVVRLTELLQLLQNHLQA